MDKSAVHRKDRLVITTIEIIDELGIQRLSTREIAKRQGISEATLFRHYKNKNHLLIAVLDHFSQFDGEIFQSTGLKKLAPKEAIIYYITSHTEYYQNYPALTSIMQIFDVLRYEKDLADKVKTIFQKRTDYLKQLIEDAQESGEISSDIDSRDLADMILGICREICLRWRIENQGFPLTERTIAALKVLLKASNKMES